MSETATTPIPIHWRRPSCIPKKRSASTARKTRSSREHRLTDRDRCERQRGHVQRERHHGNAPADAPPSRGEQIDRAAQRMAHVDIGRSDRTPVLEQEREVRCKRGEQRADEAHANRQRDVCHSGAVFGALNGLKDATPAAGAGSRQPRYALRATVAGIVASWLFAGQRIRDLGIGDLAIGRSRRRAPCERSDPPAKTPATGESGVENHPCGARLIRHAPPVHRLPPPRCDPLTAVEIAMAA